MTTKILICTYLRYGYRWSKANRNLGAYAVVNNDGTKFLKNHIIIDQLLGECVAFVHMLVRSEI